MQITEIALLNSSETAYITNQLDPRTKVVVSIDGYLQLGVVKSLVETKEKVELCDFVRIASKEDNLTNCENCKYARSILPEIKNSAEQLNLDMKIGFITISLDKNKITVNYTAEDRVDFRELIKVLGTKYKTKIEMKQIGNRDEAKAIGSLGVCGRETCCKAFLGDFDKLSIKMAKNQNLSLNPGRINGMCGRLLCCLKYEDEFYEEMLKKMPKVGKFIETPNGKGQVKSIDVLKETITVEYKKDDSTEIKIFTLSELTNANK